MEVILYTDTDKVRAALGLTERDLADIQITNQDLVRQLRADFYGWLTTHATIYTDGTAVGATDQEVYQADLLALYCTAFCAARTARTLLLAAPQEISDGKDLVKRFSGNLETIAAIQETLAAKYKAELQVDAGLTTAVVATSPLSLSLPAYDPVTNT